MLSLHFDFSVCYYDYSHREERSFALSGIGIRVLYDIIAPEKFTHITMIHNTYFTDWQLCTSLLVSSWYIPIVYWQFFQKMGNTFHPTYMTWRFYILYTRGIILSFFRKLMTRRKYLKRIISTMKKIFFTSPLLSFNIISLNSFTRWKVINIIFSYLLLVVVVAFCFLFQLIF